MDHPKCNGCLVCAGFWRVCLWMRRALCMEYEPTGNLDSKTSMDVLGLMKTSSYKFKQTLVMITHNDEIAQLADRIIHIEDGKIVQ